MSQVLELEEQGATANPPVSIDALKKERTALRKEVTRWTTEIIKTIHAKGSRRYLQILMKKIDTADDRAKVITDAIADTLPASAVTGEYERQMQYTAKVDDARELISQYLEERKDDGPSEAASQVGEDPLANEVPRRPVGLPPNQEIWSESDIRMFRPIEEEEPNVTLLQRTAQRSDIPFQFQARRPDLNLWARRAVPPRFRPDEAPDDWILSYVQGFDNPDAWASYSSNSSVKTDLGTYDGTALKWFDWIGLFKSLVHDTGKSADEKLAILRRNLRGDCQDIVYGLGGGEPAYKEALLRLRESCGRRSVMRAAHLQAIEKLDPGRGNPNMLKRYAERVRTHLYDLCAIGERSNVDTIDRICLKLSNEDRLAWNEAQANRGMAGDLNKFGVWLSARAAAYQNPHDVAREQARTQQQQDFRGQRQQARTNQASSNHGRSQDQDGGRRSCPKCSSEHRLDQCSEFKSLSISDRLSFMSRSRLCFYCFGRGLPAFRCQQSKACGIDGCTRRHHRLLHESSSGGAADRGAATGGGGAAAGDREAADRGEAPDRNGRATLAASVNPSLVALGVLRSTVCCPDVRMESINILLDEGSDSTLVRDGLLRDLGIEGEPHGLNIQGVTGVETRFSSQRVWLKLLDGEGGQIEISASSLPKVCSSVPKVAWDKVKRKWSHLDDLPLKETGGRIDLLLGLDHASLLIPTDYRVGEPHEPCAWRTKLGWVVRGPLGEGRSRSARTNLLFGQPDFNLDVEFQRFCETESFGTEHHEPKKALTADEKRALDIVNGGTRKLTVGYEVALPWKEGEPSLPNNRLMAEHRLKGLLRRFQQDPAFEKEYRAAIEKYAAEGYARKVTDPKELAVDDQYLLAHFGVYKKSAKVKKVRIVFDSAAPFRGKSLNDALLTGPVLQNSLAAVLIRFREGAVAFTADIEAMFSRIRLREADARLHRFLFQDPDSDIIDVYQMDRLTFGDKCSPFVAIHTLRRTALDYGEGDEEVVKAIRDNTYVDDWLESRKSVPEAVTVAKKVTAVLEKGDFKLRGWMSNSSQFIEEVTEEKQSAQPEVQLGSEQEATVLGVVWRPGADSLSFSISKLPERSQTRRGLTGRLASIYDPLGLASPLTIKAKIQLRRMDVRGLGWDDLINTAEEEWWKLWESQLVLLNRLIVARCLFPDEDSIERRELHTFSDASEEAFASVVYLRRVYQDGVVRANIVMAKTKMAQKKTISVAKLELQAALLGSRLARYVCDALTRPIDLRRFWTDSSCVRNWVRATSASYKPFVSHRIGEIQQLTEADEWRFVPGKLNPSDAATRSSLEVEEIIPKSWAEGPEFLVQPESEWPVDIPWIAPAEEIRPTKPSRVNVMQVQEPKDWAKVSFDPDDLPSYTELKGELLNLLKRCQSEAFSKEIKDLQKRKEVKRSSALLELSPCVGEDGLLRLGGRAGRAPLPNENLHPIILPAKHPLTFQLIWAFHRKHNHCGTDFVLSHVRDYYWPIRGKDAVKKVSRKCPSCIRERTRPAIQKMADLPIERLAVHTPAFHHTAVDYFGPLEVAYGRGRSVKRYGALFTCLTTRAVYLDLAKSLSTEDFLLVLRRFLSFYSKPESIHSDNGTNFVGAEKELVAPVGQLNQDPVLAEALKRSAIKWKFQPPSAPHFGGAHESLVRVTKLSLYRMLKKENKKLQYPSEDMMRTFLCEVAAILNDRPLVKCSSDPRDYRPLTPNDLLGKRSGLVLPMSDPKDALPRQNYLYVQKMANQFWDLWIKFYLPSLVARRKWQLKERNFRVGDHVLVVEPNLPRGRWSTGKVTETFPGADGLVRVVTVQTESGVSTRPIHRLCLLQPAEDDPSSGSGESPSGEDGAATA